MKKYTSILLSLMFIFSFSSPFFAYAEVLLSTEKITASSVSLIVKGVLPNTSLTFSVRNQDDTTPNYSQNKTVTSDKDGVASNPFTGLSPEGKYEGAVIKGANIISKITFTPAKNTTSTTSTNTATKTTSTAEEKEITTQTTLKISEISITGTEIIISTTTKWTDVPDIKKERELIALLFDSKQNKVDEKKITNTSTVSGFGSIRFEGLKPETEYLARVYLRETTIRPLQPDETELIKTTKDNDLIKVKTATIEQKNLTSVNIDEVFNIIPEIGATENRSRYNFLAPIGGIKCMDWSEESNKVGADGKPECIDNNIGTYLNFIFKLGIGLCAALAVIMLIIYGVMYMGDESIFAKTEAKKKMLGAVTGLLIALGAWALLNTINPDLTGVKGFKIDQVSIEVQPNSIFVKPATADNLARCHVITTGDCSVENLSKTFGNKAEAMSKICSMESSGDSKAKSGTDVSKDQPPLPFSFGLFQINLLANGSHIKDSKGETCGNLFIRSSDEKPTPPADYIDNGVYDAKLKPGMQSKYDDCKTTLFNSTENIRIAKILFDGAKNNKTNGSMQPWVGDKAACPSAFQ